MRIAIIGAGGYRFPLRLVRDVLAFESTQDTTFAPTDMVDEMLAAEAAWLPRL